MAAPISDALVKAIAQEASEVAGQFLTICIRAVDYCPPADMEMGEFLRALITADGDVERTDKYGFREALMRSFRRRLVFPDHVKFMTEESVRWDSIGDRLRVPGLAFSELSFDGEPGQPAGAKELDRRARALAGSSPTRSTRRCSSWWRRLENCRRGSRTHRPRRWSRSG